MAQYGLGNFVYELTVEGGNAKFKFFDPEDAGNTAEVSIHQDDFPEGIRDADSRQVADVAYAKVSEQLNQKRDDRLEQQKADEVAQAKELDQRNRTEAQDFFDNTSDVAVAPVKTEKDGTTVYNTAEASDSKQEDKKNKK